MPFGKPLGAHPRIHRDHPPGARAQGAARASRRALRHPLYRARRRPGSRKPLRSIIHGDPSLKIYTASVSPAGLRTAGEVADGVLPFFMSPEKAEAIVDPIVEGRAQGRQAARPRRFRQRALCAGQHGRRSRRMPRRAAPRPRALYRRDGRARSAISTTIWPSGIGYEAAAARSRTCSSPASDRRPPPRCPTR